MNKAVTIIAAFVLAITFTGMSQAAEKKEQKKELNLSQLMKVSEMMKRNPGLFKNREALNRFIAMNKKLQKKQ